MSSAANPTPHPNPNPNSNPNPNPARFPPIDPLPRFPHDSSGTSDVMDEEDDEEDVGSPANGGSSRGCLPHKGLPSKNLVSERKRRKRLNEKLLSLRAIVPNISKMDKASIVSDAITYVRQLQQQVAEIQADIAELESQKEDSLQKDMKHVKAEKMWKHSKDMKRVKVKKLETHQIISLEVSKMEDHIYLFRIQCRKTPGILVQLTQALEALNIKILNANLTSVDDHILNTLVVEVKKGSTVNTADDLRDVTLQTVPKFGFILIEGFKHCGGQG